MKTCYTVILGGYDQLKNPEVITEGWKYICYTDTPEICEGTVYKPVPVDYGSWQTAQFAKRLKWFKGGYAENTAVYHDGNFQVKGNLDDFVKEFENSFLVTRPHSHRSSVLDEIDAIRQLDKDPKAKFDDLIKAVFESKKFKDENLYENGVLIFNPHLDINKVAHFARKVALGFTDSYTSRDQPIVPYVAWQHNFPITTMPRQHVSNFFNYNPKHLK